MENDLTGTPESPEATVDIGSGFTADQQRQMANWMVEDGVLTREQADEALRNDGVAAMPAVDPDVQGLTAIGFPPATEREVKVPLIVGEDGLQGPQHKETDASIRGWRLASGLPAPILNSVIKNADTFLQRLQDMTDAQRELNAASEKAKLEKLFGADTKARIEDARRVVREIEAKKPGFTAWLDTTGLGDSHELITQLALHGLRLREIRNG